MTRSATKTKRNQKAGAFTLDEGRMRDLVAKAVDAVPGFDVEVIASERDEALARFGNNVVTQHVGVADLDLSIRVQKAGRQGRASVNQFSDQAVRQAARSAAEMAEIETSRLDLLALAEPQNYRPINHYVAQTAGIHPDEKVDRIKETTARCRKKGFRAAGIYSTGQETVGLGNSRGLVVVGRQSTATFSLTVMGPDSSGWAEATHRDVNRIDPESLTEAALSKALAGRKPKAIKPGLYDLVLEPAAVADLLLFMAWEGFGAVPIQEGRSFLSGRMGEKLFDERITIRDDVYHPETIGLNFDFEGMPRQAVTLIERGVARGMVHDRKTAKQSGVITTGHALPQPNTSGPMPINLVMAPGDQSLEALIAGVERGLLVTHFHYTNTLDPVSLEITGMTRDGLFWIENGKVKHPVKNFRFTESIVSAMNRISGIGRESVYSSAFWGGGGIICPALTIRDFNFSSATEF